MKKRVLLLITTKDEVRNQTFQSSEVLTFDNADDYMDFALRMDILNANEVPTQLGNVTSVSRYFELISI